MLLHQKRWNVVPIRRTVAPQATILKRGVLAQGLVYGGSGYADETLAVVLGLADRGIHVELKPRHSQTDTRNLLSAEVQQKLEIMKQQRVDPATSVLFQSVPAHEFDLQKLAKYRVGRTMFEAARIPAEWLEYCNAMDEVWVPSTFNLESFAASGVPERKLRVVPEGVHTNLYYEGAEPLKLPGMRGFNFLSMFEWCDRKGPDVLLKAFVSEFKADEDVALIIKAYRRPDPNADLLTVVADFIERTLQKRIEDIPPIILLPGFLPNRMIPRLYASADAFVLPSRGEGWGRPYMEALACGCPVIATRWSGQLDFLNDRNSFLIDATVESTPANVDIEVFAGQRWAEPNVEHLRELMRYVFNHRQEAKARASVGTQEMYRLWDWDLIIERWVHEFQRLLD